MNHITFLCKDILDIELNVHRTHVQDPKNGHFESHKSHKLVNLSQKSPNKAKLSQKSLKLIIIS